MEKSDIGIEITTSNLIKENSNLTRQSWELHTYSYANSLTEQLILMDSLMHISVCYSQDWRFDKAEIQINNFFY